MLTAGLHLPAKKQYENSIFINYSSEAFTGYWNGKGRTFQPGETKLMPEYLAYHFARTLANRELIKLGKERSTSPKFPEQVPDFMEQLNKAYKLDDDPDEPIGDDKDDIDVLMRVAEKNRAKLPEGAQGVAHKKPQELPRWTATNCRQPHQRRREQLPPLKASRTEQSSHHKNHNKKTS